MYNNTFDTFDLDFNNIEIDDLDNDFTEQSFKLIKENPLIDELKEFTSVSLYKDKFDRLRADLDLSNFFRFLNKKQGNINNLIEQLDRIKRREYYNHKAKTTFVSARECKFDGLNMFKTRFKIPITNFDKGHSFKKIKEWLFNDDIFSDDCYINCYSDKSNIKEYQKYKYLLDSDYRHKHDLDKSEKSFISKYENHIYVFDVQITQDFEKNMLFVDYVHNYEDFPFLSE